MAAKDVVIKISASDAASPTFKRIASEAKAMGAQVSTSAKQSSESLDDMQKKGAAVGAAFGAMVGGVSLAGRAFVSQEQQIRGLNRAYGESSVEIQRFAEEMQKSTTYSNDAARQAAQVASTLTRSYGLTADQIQLLIGTTADLAAVNVTSTGAQFDLVDAVSRTAGAIRGEGEAAEALGLTLSDSAVAAEAAARGLTGWTTTMTEAEKAQFRFTLLLEQATYAQGAAADAAETNAGKAKQFVNELQDQVQAFGEATGAAGQYLSVMGDMALALPLLTGLLGKLGAGLGAIGGAGALAPLALIAGGASLAYGYSQDDMGTTNTNQFWNEFFKAGSSVMNTLLPGNPYSTSKYDEQMSANQIGDALIAIFGGDGGDSAAINRANIALGSPAFSNRKEDGSYNVFNYDEEDLKKYVGEAAAAAGVTVGEYLLTAAKSSNLVLDPVTGTYKTAQEYQSARLFRNTGSNTSGAFTLGYGLLAGQPTPYTGAYQPNGGFTQYSPPQYYGDINTTAPVTGPAIGGAASKDMSGYRTGPADSATYSVDAEIAAEHKRIAEAIGEENAAYLGLFIGVTTANDALTAFKATQDGLSAEMDVYQAQASEYSGQLNAQEAAYKILEERQANGIELTKEQTDFMNNYAHAVEVGTGAVEDSTLAAGMNAQQLLLNKEAADIFKEANGPLVESIDALTEALGGIPPSVETEIRLTRAGADIDAYLAELTLIPPSVTTVLNTVTGGGVTVPGGTYTPGNTPYGLDGLTMSAYAGGGTVYGGNHALVGERGPELVWLPNGAQVMNTEGSKSRMNAGRRGGGDIVNYGPINLQPASTDVYGALSSQLMGGVR